MAVIDNPIMSEVNKVFESGPKAVNWHWDAIFHPMPEDKLEILRVLEIDIDRNYIDMYSDDITLVVLMLKGDYDHDVYPFRDTLEVTLKARPVPEHGTGLAVNPDEELIFRFKGVLHDTKDRLIEGNAHHAGHRDQGNIGDIRTVSLQLLHPIEEEFRHITTGGTFRSMRAIDVVRYLLGKISSSLDIDDDQRPLGVDVADGAIDTIRDHVIIPPMRLVNLPKYVHKNCGGLYQTDVHYYLQGKHWFIYPPYNVKRFDDSKPSLTLVNVPMTSIPTTDRSYRVSNGQVYIVATGEVKQIDPSEDTQLNEGVGVRFLKATQAMDNFLGVAGNRAIASRGMNVFEALLSSRKDGLNQIKVSSEKITDNVAYQLSKVAPRLGTFIQITWEHANIDILTPGMPVRYMFAVRDSVSVMHGTLVRAQYFVENEVQGVAHPVYKTSAALTVFLERVPETP